MTEEIPRMHAFDETGWLVKDKGLAYLATSRGWFQLHDVPRGSGHECPARVVGKLVEGSVVKVDDLISDGSIDTSRARPHLVAHPKPQLAAASDLRSAAEGWLRDRGFPYVTLPQAWFRTEEYGEVEFALRHPAQQRDLRMLQSPELPLYLALAGGLGRCYTFGRCFRHELVHDPDVDRTYLMEFEQLVVGLSLASLEEAVDLGEELVVHLASSLGIVLSRDAFVRTDHRRAAGRDGLPLALDDVRLFTLPATWPEQAVRVFVDRLTALGAGLHAWTEGELVATEAAAVCALAGREIRLAVTAPPAAMDDVRRVLDVARSMSAGTDVDEIVALQWNPTWQLHPSLAWREGEQRDSTLDVRSFTSQRATDGDGTVIRDAELHLDGVEVVHVREYAPVRQLVEQARTSGARGEYDYLLPYADAAPGGLVGIFVGWERLSAVMLGRPDAHDALLFPRTGNGTLSWPAPEDRE